MNKDKIVYLVYQKDFSEKGKDRYFIYDKEQFSEVSSEVVASLGCIVVTHDFWLISNSLFERHERLPCMVIDVVLLSKIVAGLKLAEGDVQLWDIQKTIRPLYSVGEDLDSYLDMYYRRKELDEDIYMLFSHKLAEYYERLIESASNSGELNRFFDLELPIYNILCLSACRGIPVSNKKIREHKNKIKLEFYRQLKSFAEKHKVLYALPNEGEIKEKLCSLGYKVQDYSLDFLIDFLPSRDGYTDDLRNLQKIDKSYRVFNSISVNVNRLRPIVESHWTSTSRIYHKSPSIQNVSKKYRDIFVSDEGMSLCYVDYDQFEVGVMAALSADPKMQEIYEKGDAYQDLAGHIFNNISMRKKAKVLFLSYTYGMSLENLISSVAELGGDQKIAMNYFSEFSVFEKWKESIYKEFFDNGRVATISANYLNRNSTLELSDKERRTSVNHVVQGSATYIFKKALLQLSEVKGVQILIPMHDAVLFQYDNSFDPKLAVEIFEDVMTKELNDKISAKASIEEFFVPIPL